MEKVESLWAPGKSSGFDQQKVGGYPAARASRSKAWQQEEGGLL